MPQQSLFAPVKSGQKHERELRAKRSGTFVDNMKLPVHRWFRYSAGFSAEWVKSILLREKPESILDPFSGSGTVGIVADELEIRSCGYEAHPFVHRLATCKAKWHCDGEAFIHESRLLIEQGKTARFDEAMLSDKLLTKCYSVESLTTLLRLKSAWLDRHSAQSGAIGELLFLALTAILRNASSAGTAQWQYILPEKKKAKVIDPEQAFHAQTLMMAHDMRHMQEKGATSLAVFYNADSRKYDALSENAVDLVVTSPPYANNYDYADATRLEMTFWGEVSCWGDLHEAARKYLICSSAQHASKEKFRLDRLLDSPFLENISSELTPVCNELAEVRETKGGKKHYHTMIAAYFNDMAQVFRELRRVVKPRGKMFFVIGDSAPYGVYLPVDRWLGSLAIAAGFSDWSFEKIRDRNIKWENRKHRVPLKEGILRID